MENKLFLKLLLGLLAPLGLLGLVCLHKFFHQPFSAFDWLSCVFFYACVFSFLIGIVALGFELFNPVKETQYKILLGLLSLFFVLSLTEFILRIFCINQAYIERRTGKYVSAYIAHDNNVNRAYFPGSVTFLQASEYKYPRHHNNLGFSDNDFFEKASQKEILIQTYGDSFTEGDGAPADSSYPALLRALLKRDGHRQIIVQNFGICGNDPGFYWKQFKDIGAKLKPDVVVITYDCGDMTTDFLTKGGIERFKDGYYKGLDGPWWEWLYGVSYVYRLFAVSIFNVQYNTFFLSEEQRAQRLKELEPRWIRTFEAIADVARINHVKVLLVKKPERREVDANQYSYDYSFFEKVADTISCFKRIDLLPYYRDSVHINKDNSAKYWWPIDGHNQGAGYALMAGGIYAGLMQRYPEIFFLSDSAAISPQIP